MERTLEVISIDDILGLQRKEATALGTGRCADRHTRPPEGLDVTRRTVEAFQPVARPCEAAVQAPMAQWRLDGRPRTARRHTTDQNCPRPTPEDRRWCLLVYRQTSPLQVMPGRLFGMGQCQAPQWLQVLLVVPRARLRTRGAAPTRSVTELAKRLGMAETEAT